MFILNKLKNILSGKNILLIIYKKNLKINIPLFTSKQGKRRKKFKKILVNNKQKLQSYIN